MGKTFLLIFFVSLSAHSWAQPLDGQRYADSLNTVLEQSTSDSIKARTYFRLSQFWRKDILKAKPYLEKGKSIAKENPYIQALSYFYLGQLYVNSDLEKSESAFMKADKELSRFATKEAFLLRAMSWSNYGGLQQQKDHYEATADILINKVIPLGEKSGDSLYVGRKYADLGLMFRNLEQFDKAEEYYNRAIERLKKSPLPSSDLAEAYIYAAKNYVFLKKYPLAKTMLSKAKAIIVSYPESELFIDYYAVESLYFIHIKAYEKALSDIDKGMVLATKLQETYELQTLLYQKYQTFAAQGEFEKAKQTLLMTMSMNTLDIAENNRNDYYELSEIYAKLGQTDSAYIWSKRYGALSDSVNDSRLKHNINALEVKYQQAEKQKEIVMLKAKSNQAILSARNSRLLNWLLASVSMVFLMIAFLAFLHYRNNKKFHQQQLKEVEQRQQLQYSLALLEGEEKERRRLARDLHDGLGGLLASVKMSLSGLRSATGTTEKSDLKGVIDQVDGSLIELRRIAHNMMPIVLLKFGLETALRDLCDMFMNKRIDIEFQTFNIVKNISEQTQLTIYRIIQELLTNSVRHGGASNIVLQCSQNQNRFFITVEDNGKGFSTDTLKEKKGLGLDNIESRVSFLKGTLEIESVINEGTTVNIELPVG